MLRDTATSKTPIEACTERMRERKKREIYKGARKKEGERTERRRR